MVKKTIVGRLSFAMYELLVFGCFLLAEGATNSTYFGYSRGARACKVFDGEKQKGGSLVRDLPPRFICAS